jgi:hypothetical protein
LFADLELYLRQLGFSFYGFLTQHTRSKKSLNKKTNFGKERLFYADAVFFKDPLSFHINFSPRQYYVLIFAAILTGFYDFALELIAVNVPENERRIITDLIHSISYVNPKTSEEQINMLINKMENDKENANILLGKFLDSVSFPDFEDYTTT